MGTMLKGKFKAAHSFLQTTVGFAKNDLKKRYAGSVLGGLWAYIQTLVMVLIYWVVFQYGLKNGNVAGVPFLPWFICGMMPWLLFTDIINSSMYCMSEYSYIVKKVVFNIDIIPASKTAVCLFIYSFFLAVVFIVVIGYGFLPGLCALEAFLYLALAVLLALPIAYASSAVSVFLKDYGQIVSIVLSMMMWATPIVWDIVIVPERFRWIIYLNPAFFVVSGMRNALIYGVSIVENLPYLLYFLAVTALAWAGCLPLYRRLLPHLADVL